MANREEKLAKNTFIFAIGSLGSKLIQIILVPFYTRILTSEQYGTADVLQAMVSLLIPIAGLAIYESVFRYVMDKDYDKVSVLSVGILVTAVGTAVLCVGGVALTCFETGILNVMSRLIGFDVSGLFIWLVIANTAVNALWTVISNYTRAVGHSVLFMLNNIMMTGLVLILNIIFLAVLRLGVIGYMLGYTLANLLTTIFLIVSLKNDFKLRYSGIQRELYKEMLVFAFPLILNGICWWLSAFTDRMMITAMLGPTANGLYAAASKIPQLLSVVVTVFFQAWQMSANEEFKSKDIGQFYSQIFEQISACIFLIGSVLIIMCRPITSVFLGSEFAQAWRITPALVLMTVFFSFCQFLISIYSANKKTTMAFITNLVCVVVNITLNWLLIPVLGTLGAAIATATAYLVLWIVRVVDTGKIVRIQYHTARIIISVAILIIQSVLIFADTDFLVTYSFCAIGFLIILIVYRKTLITLAMFSLRLFAKILCKH